ncbi:MAG TPA: type II secretion system protein M [Gammaproteobacteria bacterium]|nr:type II secretion system protein M [Gammaproteobacteria bacterium]
MSRIDELRTWYLSLQERERRVLMVGAAALVAMLLYTAVLHPYFSSRRRLEQDIVDQRDLIAWMRPAAAQIQSLRGQQPSGMPAGQSLLAVVDKSASDAGFGATVKQIQTGNDGSVRVQMQGVAFDGLVRWLGSLQQRYGITVREMTAQRSTSPGNVDAGLTLVAPAT